MPALRRLCIALAVACSLAGGPILATERVFVTVPATNQVRSIDPADGRVLAELAVPSAATYHNTVLTRAGLLMVAHDEAITLIDVEAARVVKTVPLPPPVVAMPGADDRLLLQNVDRKKRHLVGFDYEERTGSAYAAVADAAGETTLYRLDPERFEVQILSTLRDVGQPRDLVVSGDGLRLYLSGFQSVPEPAARVWSINPLNGERGEALPVSFDPKRPALSLSADGNLLYLMSADQSVVVINTRSNRPINRLRPELPEGRRLQRVIGSPDDRHLWLLCDRALLLWDSLQGSVDLSQSTDTAPIDVALSADKTHLWSLVAPDRRGELRQYDSQKPELPLRARTPIPAGANRLIVWGGPPSLSATQLPKVAVVGFETGIVRYGQYPNVADSVGGSLLRSRRYEIVSPVQVKSVLETLSLSPSQLLGDAAAIRQVGALLGADVVLVGAPLAVQMPDRALERLAGFVNPYLALILPQFSAPRVLTQAEAFDQEGQSIWKAQVINFDDPFFTGKVDSIMLRNAMVITAEDIANRFSQGDFNRTRALAARSPLPPLAESPALRSLKRVAVLGPDKALFNSKTNRAESLGRVVAEKLRRRFGWEVTDPDESFAVLSRLGIEPAQLTTTDPKYLARALGVDAVMVGLARSSIYITGGFLGFGFGASSDVVLQFQLVDQNGEVLWKDVQVRNIGTDNEGEALSQGSEALVESLDRGIAPPPKSS
jgi:WD40 repeat protein